MSKLTQEEKRIRLAKAEGWTCPHGRNGVWPHRLDLSTVANVAVMHGVPPGQTQEVYGEWPNVHDNLKPVPDYFGDMNAALSAVRASREKLTDSERWSRFAYLLEDRHKTAVLEDACNRLDYFELADFLSSLTADDYSEALGQALELWKEGE